MRDGRLDRMRWGRTGMRVDEALEGICTSGSGGWGCLVGTGVVEWCMGMDRDEMGICDVIWRYILGLKS